MELKFLSLTEVLIDATSGSYRKRKAIKATLELSIPSLLRLLIANTEAIRTRVKLIKALNHERFLGFTND